MYRKRVHAHCSNIPTLTCLHKRIIENVFSRSVVYDMSSRKIFLTISYI